MKALVYSTNSIMEPHFGTLIEEAEEQLSQKNEVTVAYCAGFVNTCFVNPTGSAAICKFCRWNQKRLMKRFANRAKVIALTDPLPVKHESFTYETAAQIKALKYRDVAIGYGIMSTYVSLTRNPDPEITSESRKYFDTLIEDACRSVDWVYKLLEDEKPDSAAVFNGRWYEQKPMFELCQKQGIPIHVNEVVGGFRSGVDNLRYIYDNCTPHDIDNYTKLIDDLWNLPNESSEEKERKGRDFYERRRKGIVAGDRVYTGMQKSGQLPDVDKNREKIVIFNTSEDEYSSLGEDFEKLAVFESQLAGVDFICNAVKGAPCDVFVRIHPNLKDVSYAYHTDLYKLAEKHDNLTLIPADSPCSSYELLDVADKVVVFGSSIGIEAVYWKKPVILLAGSIYCKLGACYQPQSPEELTRMLLSPLEPIETTAPIRYGYMILNRHLTAIPFRHIDMHTVRINILTCKILTTAYPKLLGSATLMQLLRSVIVIFCRRFTGKVRMPNPVFIDRIVE